jgi:hypothetical protein
MRPTQPHFQVVPGSRFPRVKQTELGTDHSILFSAEANLRGATPPLLHMFSWPGALLRTGTTLSLYRYVVLYSIYKLKFKRCK